MPDNRTFAIIGLGNFGGTVARELMRFGNDVIGVDKDEAKVQALADDLSEALIADAQDEDALKDCGVADARGVLISCGDDISASILAAMNVKLLGVERIWVKAESNVHHRVLARLGVDRVVRPDQEAGRQVAHGLHNPLVRDFVSLGNGLHMVNATVPESLEGKSLGELELDQRFELRCLGVMRGQDYMAADRADLELRSDDQLLLLGLRDALSTFADSL